MCTVLLSAFLLFQVQPMVGKVLLPAFGGTPAVWMTCMLFFQVMLLLGYAYSHFVAVRLGPRAQGIVHLGLLLWVLSRLPLSLSAGASSASLGDPTWEILLALTSGVAVPFLVLSSTGPLLQSWFARFLPGRSYYRLYALSNAGSFLALLSYPFLIEPALHLENQAALWSVGGVVFAMLCGTCAAGSVAAGGRCETRRAVEDEGAAVPSRPRALDVVLWLALATCGSTMLLAVTNQLCQNVAAVPLLWVCPLALYLLSFVLCFDHPRWYARRAFTWSLVAVLGVSPLLLVDSALGLPAQIAIYLAMLFVCCMCSHGELYRIRPNARHLTLFFLVIAAGGALGGVLVSLVAPAVFNLYLELPVGLAATCLFILLARRRDALQAFVERRGLPRVLRTSALVTAGSLGALSCGSYTIESWLKQSGVLTMTRNFYGTLRVSVIDAGEPDLRRVRLTHGTTVHGTQFQAPDKRRLATSYYGPGSGVAYALERARDQGPLDVGIVGLGVGTLAAYGERGDRFRFYEINPTVAAHAERYFGYLSDARERGVSVELRMGDARRVMEAELAEDGPNDFDVLVVDAFSSDAIPVHLLTEECFALYLEHVREGGTVAIHVSNRFLDLAPLVRGLAARSGRAILQVDAKADPSHGTDPSRWLLVAEAATLEALADVGTLHPEPRDDEELPVWTDRYSSLLSVLK